MSAFVQVVGNAVGVPTRRTVFTLGEQKVVTEVRLIANVRRRLVDGDGVVTWVDDPEKTQAYDCALWNEAQGESMMRVLKKGMSIMVSGDMTPRRWKGKEDGLDRFGLSIAVDKWFLNPARIASVVPMAVRGGTGGDEALPEPDAGSPPVAGAGTDAGATYTSTDITEFSGASGADSAAGSAGGNGLAADDHPGAGVESDDASGADSDTKAAGVGRRNKKSAAAPASQA